ncbi:MAG: site-specific DNA-methyltransferase [Leptolyngbya sp. UWPOB_LEPTO1]|uniref:site-specific DNA-methyltransferase n=1 Tax=Leptolyngbya sp. UWPOB_LEPTO1 TaxID=2815653 RepID=UPI001AD2F705|nr:DNA methyltransferase [Leptolyngbya sp. UWPOB_LEPTO1]MBN8561067.1 site-specific DNA-methyltransferase [Leptolyngbya sp. UWPOB_LEPTO1]
MVRSKPAKIRSTDEAKTYSHPESDSPLRPEVGTQAHFPKKKLKAPKIYRYDSSISPSLEWDTNPARDQTDALIAEILNADSLEQVKAAALRLKAMSQPFLNWTGKAERLSFDVPTLPLFIHERLSTRAIIETVRGHKKGGDQLALELFGDPQHSIVDQTLKAYEHRDEWVNRMMLGDSLTVMNSLLEYEGLGGQVQMIYIDPPYGVKFGSNFQPFVRKRDVKHNEDQDMTREPEMVKAYRDTWEMGLHSYLSYLRDRLVLARELLIESGSVFVQIGNENVHHVRELMDEVFGTNNFVSIIQFQKTGGSASSLLASTVDYLIWYAKDKEKVKYRQLYIQRQIGDAALDRYDQVLLPDGSTRRLTADEILGLTPLLEGKRYQLTSLISDGATNSPSDFVFEGKTYIPRAGTHWKTTVQGLEELARQNRIEVMGTVLRYRRFVDDFPVIPLTDRWESTQLGVGLMYVVQTSPSVIQRCILMTTDPGDLVLDPTCGSGTTAYVAEQWGRRWITCDVSRVPLALARQRLLTATFPYYELKDSKRGPAGGFVYRRKQNKKGEEVGGIVPHIQLQNIANNERPKEEILVDRPEILKGITRVTGAFTFEATIPTPVQTEEQEQDETLEATGSFVDRLLGVLRKTPVLQLGGNRTVKFQSIRKPTRSLNLSAEATIATVSENGNGATPQPVAFVFGPENGQVIQRTVYQSAIEACAKNYSHLYVIGFAIEPNARELIENCEEVTGIPATYVQATPDLLMGDLLKNMRSSQIFSVCGLPDVGIQLEGDLYRATLYGLDVFDPVTMESDHRSGNDVPAWFLDTDYNGLCFHVCQAFFPKTGAWDNLKKALKNTHEESVWGHLAGTISAPFEAGKYRQIAVKVIDDRGNELLVVKSL